MAQRGLPTTGGFFDRRKKSLEHVAKLRVSNFLEFFKITSVGLKLDRSHNRPRYQNSNVVAGLPVPMGYDCFYDSACDHYSTFDFE